MRPASLLLIVSLILLAVACGGSSQSSQTPSPTSVATQSPLAVAAVVATPANARPTPSSTPFWDDTITPLPEGRLVTHDPQIDEMTIMGPSSQSQTIDAYRVAVSPRGRYVIAWSGGIKEEYKMPAFADVDVYTTEGGFVSRLPNSEYVEASWSPAFDLFAYVADGSLFYAEAPDFAPTEQPIDIAGASSISAEFISRDFLDVVAYFADAEGNPYANRRTFVMSYWTGQLFELPEGAFGRMPSVSSDATKIAYPWSDPNSGSSFPEVKLGIFDLATGRQCVADSPVSFRMSRNPDFVPEWSPDSQYVLYSDDSSMVDGLLVNHVANASDCSFVTSDRGGNATWDVNTGHDLLISLVEQNGSQPTYDIREMQLARWDLESDPQPFLKTERYPQMVKPGLFLIRRSESEYVFADEAGSGFTIALPEHPQSSAILSPSGRYLLYESEHYIFSVDTIAGSWSLVGKAPSVGGVQAWVP